MKAPAGEFGDGKPTMVLLSSFVHEESDSVAARDAQRPHLIRAICDALPESIFYRNSMKYRLLFLQIRFCQFIFRLFATVSPAPPVCSPQSLPLSSSDSEEASRFDLPSSRSPVNSNFQSARVFSLAYFALCVYGWKCIFARLKNFRSEELDD